MGKNKLTIPIENIYYLLCYAWNKLDEKDLVLIKPRDVAQLVDLFARILISGLNHIFKRGMDRGYQLHSEELRGIRGKINITGSVKRNLFKRGIVHCEYDELSYDILHNQIIKSTIKKLLKTEGLDSSNKIQLLTHFHRLGDIREIRLTERIFNQVQLYRNNFFYDFLLNVCKLLHTNLLPSEQTGSWKFRDFSQDETQMRQLFEEFVRNFYKMEALKYKVGSEDIEWRLSTSDPEAMQYIPRMRTDISLTSVNRKIIIECKFTPEIFQTNYGIPKFRSEHLYQLNAYLTNLPNSVPNRTCEGILLYPSVKHNICSEFKGMDKQKFTITTINLSQEWKKIHMDLMKLIN